MVKAIDYQQIPALFIDYPNVTIILEVNNEQMQDEKTTEIIKQYAQDNPENFCCCIYDLQHAKWFKNKGIKFYYGYPVDSFYDVQGLINLGVEYIKISAPLTFETQTLKSKGVKFRMIPNVAHATYIPRENGIKGQWVRPEDVQYYEDAIYIFEFEAVNLDQEKTLYHIYAETGIWNGNLNLLITNLNVNVDNRAFPDELGELRSNCGQKCMKTGTCHFCDTAFLFEKTLYQHKENKETFSNQKENN